MTAHDWRPRGGGRDRCARCGLERYLPKDGPLPRPQHWRYRRSRAKAGDAFSRPMREPDCPQR